MKRSNLQIMGIEEGEDIQSKDIENLFNRIIAENFPNLEKERVIQELEAYRTPNQKKKHLQTYHNQNIQQTEQRKNTESCKREKGKSHTKASPLE
jgi:hypothetical protein